MAISYARFKAIFGDLGITEWVKYNWLSNAGTARAISNEVIEAGYNPEAYVNDELYNHITTTINLWSFNKLTISTENVTYTINDDNSITITNSTSVNGRILIRNMQAGTYALTFKTSNTNGTFAIYSMSLTQNYVSGVNTINISNYTSGPWSFLINANSTITISEVMLVKGTSALPFIPYFEGEKFLVLVGEVDLGSLTWEYVSSWGTGAIMKTNFSSAKAPATNSDTFNGLSDNYSITDISSLYADTTGKQIALTYEGVLVVVATSSSDFPNGILYYQLATPVLVDL